MDTATYHYALLRIVPHVHLGACLNIGVLMYSRTADYLGMRTIRDMERLRALAPELDLQLLASYLDMYDRICAGDASAGPVALLPSSERFHWLTAPRSDVLQCSPVHEGLGDDPARSLGELFSSYVSEVR